MTERKPYVAKQDQNGNPFLSHDEYAGFISSVSWRFKRSAKRFGMEPEDIEQTATLAFLEATKRYDPTRGSARAFMGRTITGTLQKEFRDRGWSMRMPREITDNYSRVAKAIDETTQVFGRKPSTEEVATHAGLTSEVVYAVQIAVHEGIITPTELGGENNEADTVAVGVYDTSRTIVTDIAEKDAYTYDTVGNMIDLNKALDKLPPQLRAIIDMKFGLRSGREEMTQEVIGKEFGISRMQVNRLLTQALSLLREEMEDYS